MRIDDVVVITLSSCFFGNLLTPSQRVIQMVREREER